MAITFQMLYEELGEKLAAMPELAGMEVVQSSVFDDPYCFETSGFWIGQRWSVVDKNDETEVIAHYITEEAANERCKEVGDWVKVLPPTRVVVIGSD